MNFRINGGYEAYFYVVLLQLSTLYLQRLDFNRRLVKDGEKPLSTITHDYFLTTRFVAAGLNGASWLLAVYVGQEFGFASAALFLLLGLGTTIVATVLVPPLPYADVVGHVASWPVAIYLFSATLTAVGLQTPI
jgi:hypothetical protein